MYTCANIQATLCTCCGQHCCELVGLRKGSIKQCGFDLHLLPAFWVLFWFTRTRSKWKIRRCYLWVLVVWRVEKLMGRSLFKSLDITQKNDHFLLDSSEEQLEGQSGSKVHLVDFVKTLVWFPEATCQLPLSLTPIPESDV